MDHDVVFGIHMHSPCDEADSQGEDIDFDSALAVSEPEHSDSAFGPPAGRTPAVHGLLMRVARAEKAAKSGRDVKASSDAIMTEASRLVPVDPLCEHTLQLMQGVKRRGERKNAATLTMPTWPSRRRNLIVPSHL